MVRLKSLFNFLGDYDDVTCGSIEFDPISLWCVYTEYVDLDEFKDNYTCEEYQEI